VAFGLSVLLICGTVPASQSLRAQNTETEFWPEMDAHVQFKSNLRVLAFTGLEQGVGYPFQQW